MFKRILVPVDGSEISNRALTMALRIARDSGAQVRVFHAVDQLPYMGAYEAAPQLVEVVREEAQKVLASALAIAKSAGVEADAKLDDDFLARLGDSVAAQAREWGADLIVVGTHGRRGFNRLMLGSGAEQVLRTASVPVLTVHEENTAARA